MTRNPTSSVLEKLNGYENIKQNMARKEKIDFTPLDIMYKPTFDENVLCFFVYLCFFASQFFLAYRSYLGHFKQGGKENFSSSCEPMS